MLTFCIHVCYERDYGIKEINNCHYQVYTLYNYKEKCRILHTFLRTTVCNLRAETHRHNG